MNRWPRSEASRVTEMLTAILQPKELSSDIPAPINFWNVLKISQLSSQLRFSAICSFFGQSLGLGHYHPIQQPPEGVYLLVIADFRRSYSCRVFFREKEALMGYLKSVERALEQSKDRVRLSKGAQGPYEHSLPQLILPDERLAMDRLSLGPALLSCQVHYIYSVTTNCEWLGLRVVSLFEDYFEYLWVKEQNGSFVFVKFDCQMLICFTFLYSIR